MDHPVMIIHLHTALNIERNFITVYIFVFFSPDFEKVTPNKFIPMFNRPIIRMGEVPSGNAHCSARGMARIGAAIVDGGSIDGEYRVTHLVANLGWVDFDLGCCTILLGQ